MSALIGVAVACNKGHHVGHGWGEPQPFIVFPKPTLIPKLKQAFLEGKLSVDYHKIVAPSLKPLPYKKGYGFVTGWAAGPAPGVGIYNNHFFGLPPAGFGKAGFIGVKGHPGWGVKRPVLPPIQHGWGGGPVHPPIHPQIGVTPFPPPAHGYPLPAPFLPQSHHSVHQTVSVVQKGVPHQHLGPINPHGFHGKK